MQRSVVELERHGEIAIVTLNNPEKRNVLSRAALTQLIERLGTAESCPQIKCVILASTGSVFSAGHDLREIVESSDSQREILFGLCSQAMLAIRELTQPVIAQVQGLATAAGCQLAASCDLVVAAEDAGFATPGVKIGLFCSTPAVALTRAIGAKRAMEMLLTGEAVRAQEAKQLGLVNRVVPSGELETATRQLAEQIATASSYTLGLGKRAFYEQLDLDIERAYRSAQAIMVENARAPDALEGMQAFLDRRQPQWTS